VADKLPELERKLAARELALEATRRARRELRSSAMSIGALSASVSPAVESISASVLRSPTRRVIEVRWR
jgi:vacuolar-type H+-ATPase catalytic subunit A/Vma1